MSQEKEISDLQPAAAPIDTRFTHPGCDACACPAGVCQSDRSYFEQPAPSPADERAARAEAALRALVEECENDAIAGWEERMRRRIDDANRVLARAASANETDDQRTAIEFYVANPSAALLDFTARVSRNNAASANETGAQGAKPALPIEGWYVEVAANGERVLCISDDHVAGIDDMEPFAPIVRTAAAHLINFVGAGPNHVGALVSLAHTLADTRPTDDELWDEALSERDTYQDYADKLANAIAAHLGVDIGEHSNLNNPWFKALEALESRSPAMAGRNEKDGDQ